MYLEFQEPKQHDSFFLVHSSCFFYVKTIKQSFSLNLLFENVTNMEVNGHFKGTGHLNFDLFSVFQGVSSNSSWEQAMKMIINDPRYRYSILLGSVYPTYYTIAGENNAHV